MRSIIDEAIAEIQDHIEGLSTNIKSAPAYPTEDAGVLPLGITHIASGTGSADNATDCRLLLNISADIHLDRTNLAMTYQQINSIIPEFLKRLAGDPTPGCVA